jgi:hypothetical protein
MCISDDLFDAGKFFAEDVFLYEVVVWVKKHEDAIGILSIFDDLFAGE